MLEIFDGAHIKEFSEADLAEIAALPEATRAALLACVTAVRERDACDAAMIAARSDVHQKQYALIVATAALEQPLPGPVGPNGLPIAEGPMAASRTNPALAQAKHATALQAVINANKPGYKSPKVKKNPLRDARDAAEAALQDAQATFRQCMKALQAAEALAGAATNAYRATLPTVTFETLVRGHAARSQAERQKRVDAGLPADPPKIEPNHQSVYDRERAEAGNKRKVRPLMGR
jgi:hypothetical protein